MRTFRLRILAAERTFYDGPCQSLMVPTIDGLYGLMALHENVVIAIIPGKLILRGEDGREQVAAVSEGMLKMENNEALVLVDTIERPEEIDRARAERARERAEERLRQKQSIQEYYHSQASMARAMTRLKLSSRYLK
mgnify:CR=1 FL=1